MEEDHNFFAVVLFASFPLSSVSWDRQVLLAIHREERVRVKSQHAIAVIAERGGGVGGGKHDSKNQWTSSIYSYTVWGLISCRSVPKGSST